MNIENVSKVVMLRNANNSIAENIAMEFLTRGASVILADISTLEGELLIQSLKSKNLPGSVEFISIDEEDGIFERLNDRSIDAIIHLYIPNENSDEENIKNYITRLHYNINESCKYMIGLNSKGIIINQFIMPTLFADHPLADAIIEARAMIDAYVRAACIRYGKEGVRILGLMLGLIDVPSIHNVVSNMVNQSVTPLGRWIKVEEVAKTLSFLALDSGYMTGQSLVFDGGMTGGC